MSCETKARMVGGSAARQSGITPVAGQVAYQAGQNRLPVAPQVTAEAQTRRYGRFTIGPLTPGFGVTVGNALRRTLLSSIQGAAVTSVKVEGIPHEFSTIPEVREDMTALILNLKQVRLNFKEDKPAELSLRHHGEGVVRAGDLICPPHVEVVNPDQVLLTGDNDDAQVDLTLTAETGRGFSPSEERPDLPLGQIAIDAVFSPVRKANFQVRPGSVPEMARFGRPFEQVSVEVETDGTLSPEAALRQAGAILGDHFAVVSGSTWSPQRNEPAIPYRRRLETLDLAPRTLRSLTRAGLTTVNGVMQRLRRHPKEVRRLRGLGVKSYTDLLDTLQGLDLSEEDQLILTALQTGDHP